MIVMSVEINRIKLILSSLFLLFCACNQGTNKKTMDWTNSNNYYHSSVENNEDKREAIKQLIIKILDHSKGRDPWNSLVLDKWIFNLGRLIGNIQNVDQAIGMDRGYRVALHFKSYEESLYNEDDEMKYELLIEKYNEELEGLILEVLADDKFKSKLRKKYGQNKFVFEISEQGERKGIVISLN